MLRSLSIQLRTHVTSFRRLLIIAPLVFVTSACQQQAGVLPATGQADLQEPSQPTVQSTAIVNKAESAPQQNNTQVTSALPLPTPLENKPSAPDLTDTQDNETDDAVASTTPTIIQYQSDEHEPTSPIATATDPDTDTPTTAAELLAQPYAKEDTNSLASTEESTPVVAATMLVELEELIPESVAEPAPEPLPELDLWQLTVASYSLSAGEPTPAMLKRIKPHDAWYRKHTEYMLRITKRSSRYYHYVLEQVLAAGLPGELALLPIVESGFDPFAYSHGRAAGAWQFIPSTGRMFGLKQTWWYDGRRDVVASTQAAIKYLKQLNARFDGDWPLAIAAYNGGPGTVSKAIRANKKAGKPTDYWSLNLPKETMRYVPKLLGLSQVVADHAGTDKLTSVANQPFFDIIETGSQIDLAHAAKLADISVDEIYLLNPGNNQWATDPEGPHRLLVPIAAADTFRQGLADLPANQRIAWKRHIIEPGDSLLKLSKDYDVGVDLIRSLNNLSGNVIVVGKPLMIPVASKDAEAYSLSAAQRVLKRQEKFSKTNASNRIEHEVASGESLWTIANKYKVTVNQIVAWNKIGTRALLQIGQKLNVWPRVPSTKLTSGTREVVKKLTYKVRNGDNLSKIAYRFNITVQDIQRWNSNLKKYLQPGQKLTLIIDVTKTRG